VCSVAKGTVEVTIGKKAFDISTNGMWRVRNKEACTVINNGALEAVVHLTCVGKV